MEVKGKMRDMREEIVDQRWAIEDVQGGIHERDVAFNQAMKKKLEYLDAEDKRKLGVGQFRFDLPNISDARKLYKNYCWACEHGKYCHKHPAPELKRRIDILRSEDDFANDKGG